MAVEFHRRLRVISPVKQREGRRVVLLEKREKEQKLNLENHLKTNIGNIFTTWNILGGNFFHFILSGNLRCELFSLESPPWYEWLPVVTIIACQTSFWQSLDQFVRLSEPPMSPVLVEGPLASSGEVWAQQQHLVRESFVSGSRIQNIFLFSFFYFLQNICCNMFCSGWNLQVKKI